MVSQHFLLYYSCMLFNMIHASIKTFEAEEKEKVSPLRMCLFISVSSLMYSQPVQGISLTSAQCTVGQARAPQHQETD